MVLLHGGPGLWDYLEPVARLVDTETVVHRFDQRGCGGSDPSDEQTIERAVADIEALRIHWSHERWIVLGHSYGAMLASAYAARHPDRTAAMVYLSGVGIGDWRTPYRAERARRMTPRQTERLAALDGRPRSTKEEVEFRALSWFTDHADPVRGWQWALEDAAVDHPVNFAANRALMADPDVEPATDRLTMPCWFVHGVRDPRPHEAVKALCGKVPGGRMRLLEEAGHHPWRESPGELAGLLREITG